MNRRSRQHQLAAAAGRRLDPWVEQQRREAVFRAARRRRRMVRGGVAASVVLGIGAVAVFVVLSGRESTVQDVSPTSVLTRTTPAPTTVAAPSSTISPDDLVRVGEIWLIDRGDRIYDWGVVVRTPAGAPRRSGVDVEVRLISADDLVVDTVRVALDGVDDEFPGIVSGRLVEPEVSPVRLEFDLVVGAESSDSALGELLDLRALERSGERMSGRVRAAGSGAVDDFGVLFVWRDDEERVIAAVPLDVERVRSGVDARFELDLADESVPEGLPDQVFWTS